MAGLGRSYAIILAALMFFEQMKIKRNCCRFQIGETEYESV